MQTVGESLGDKDLVKASAEMTPKQEYYLGRSIAAQILSQNQLVESAPINEYLNLLGQYLVLHSSRSQTYNGYRFAVVASEAPTALSAPGGYIFISTALVREVRSEDELAAVLAHEIAHIGLKHANQAIKKANTMKTLSKYGATLVSIVSGGSVSEDNAEFFGSAVGNVLNIKFDKDQEIDADLASLEILHASGYDPSALKRFLNRLKPEAGLLSRHPRNDARMKKIEQALVNYPGTPASNGLKRYDDWKTRVIAAQSSGS